ncbi:phage minor head protein [Rhodococcus sp. IEGM 1351]|uniref:phage head morphogenesis protein n=1 Tax=Rhodococcus sp. IEGM 1351 TaxID=3047089 RepID=UPI0024B64B9C|nr:phage minor head protein [Rhodococcus sp. IEGM 1351]MDI9934699.1 phage minor head protein [Rhodococcus sp. IEGM 1351]
MLQSVRRQFDAQRDFVLGKLDTVPVTNNFTPKQRKAWLDDVVDWSLFDDNMRKVLAPILLSLIADAGKVAVQQVGLDPSLFTVFNQSVQDYMRERSTKIAKDVNDETEKQLRATLSQGIQAGETTFELRARIEGVFGFAATTRADRIARTESTRATSFADIEGWDQSGVVEGKEWYTALDERTCPWCRDLHGRVVPLKTNYFNKGDVMEVDGKTMTVSYDDMPGCPAHVNCRCVLLPVLIEG